MYMNALIGLEENMPTYGIDGKKVNGHVTISTPGIIKCYVQNLNPKDGKEFVLYCFSSKEDKGVRIGVLASPKESRETKWHVNEQNVMNSSIKAKDIDAVAVVKEGNGMRNTDTVLVGFARNKYRISSLLQDLLPEDDMSDNNMANNGTKGPIKQGPITPIQGVSAPTQGPITPVPGSGISLFGPITPIQGVGAAMPMQGMTGPMQGMTGPMQGMTGPMQGMTGPMQGMTGPMQGMTGPMQGMTGPMQGMAGPMQGMAALIQEITALMQATECINEIEEPVEDPVEDESISRSQIERVLEETYTKKQDYRAIFDELNKDANLAERKLKEEDNQIANHQVQQETPEEISYLEEIEKKLKDIQARLKVSDTLEQHIKKFQSVEFLKRAEDVDKTSEPMQIEPSNNKLQSLYHNAPKTQPFEYKSDQIDWVRIELADLSSIPALTPKWCTQPFITFSYYKYNELILGKEKGLEKYYIGIPDIYHPERKNILDSDMKVESFLCRKNIMPAIGEYGYWLVSL